MSITLEAPDGGNILTKKNGDILKKLNHYILEDMEVEIDGEKVIFLYGKIDIFYPSDKFRQGNLLEIKAL